MFHPGLRTTRNSREDRSAPRTGRQDRAKGTDVATIRDVARAAGVSIATVSRVYNNQTLVNPQTAQHILKIAGDLDYVPNPAARSLTTRRTHTFGVLLPDLFGEFYSELIRGIDLIAHRNGFQILLSSFFRNSEDLVMTSKAMLGRIDGVIMMATDERSINTAAKVRKKVPVVLLNPCKMIEGCHAVAVDNVRGAKDAVSHLIGLGHRNIAMVAGPEENIDARDRLTGFRQGLTEAGLDPGAALVVPGDFRELAGYKAGATILRHKPRPTAVFAANDGMAIGLLASLREWGFGVPDDIAVVGFDDVALAGFMNPPLTTVHVDASGLGGHAVEMMLEVLAGGADSETRRIVLSPSLKIRQSCGTLDPAQLVRRPLMEPRPSNRDDATPRLQGEEEVQP